MTLKKLRELDQVGKQLGENLVALLLSGPEAEQVSAAKEMYKKLGAVYESKDQTDRYAQLIADLMACEDLKEAKDREVFRALLEDPPTLSMMKPDIKTILKLW